jgi:hypothetical protein
MQAAAGHRGFGSRTVQDRRYQSTRLRIWRADVRIVPGAPLHVLHEIVAERRANDASGRRSPHPERAARRFGIAAARLDDQNGRSPLTVTRRPDRVCG